MERVTPHKKEYTTQYFTRQLAKVTWSYYVFLFLYFPSYMYFLMAGGLKYSFWEGSIPFPYHRHQCFVGYGIPTLGALPSFILETMHPSFSLECSLLSQMEGFSSIFGKSILPVRHWDSEPQVLD